MRAKPTPVKPASLPSGDRSRTFTLGQTTVPVTRPKPGLYLVATPIGNLSDITLRALETLAGADLVACEDSRVTRKLMDRFLITTPLTPYHEHNAQSARPKLLEQLERGAAIALVSDAGTPLISDPGFKLVREALAQGTPVFPIPGPSAVLAALVSSGLPTDRFLFAGFLPPREAARRRALEGLASVPATLVLFEAPGRLASLLGDAAAVLGPRPAAVARELTKLHEELRRGTLPELAAAYAAAERPPRGELVLVVGPPEAGTREEADPAAVDGLLRAALRGLKPRKAAGEVAATTGRSANELYRRALELAREEEP
jgi:16S rRNA (cytidine1402-2'-O)-methyltransferase